jgi:carbamoyltransferase
MYILGIACYYHDSSACLLKDGVIIAAAEEERFTRKKHDSGFPYNAIVYCMKEADITIKDIDYIGFYEKPLLKFERVLHQHLEMFPRSFWTFYKAMPSWINDKLRVQGIVRRKLKYKGDILLVEHHLAHAASSFLVSPFKKAAIYTVDGVGEWETTTYGYGENNDVELQTHIDFPHSLGLLYSAATAHLGFSVNDSEYKVMGMASYGVPRYYDRFKKIIDIKEDGSFHLDMSYFVYHYKDTMLSQKYLDLFGPIRKPEDRVSEHHKDIAASLQKITEEVIIKGLNHLYSEMKINKQQTDNLCISGGVALNSVANGKILKNTKFKDLYIIPSPGDSGASIGAAAYIYFTLLNHKRKMQNKQKKNSILESAYLGPEFSDSYVKKFLDDNKIKYTVFKSENDIIKTTAKLIYDNQVVGWFQGRMEFGPRALGNRSILANPCNPKMKDILNLKVKHREAFRPFAPVVCLEDAKQYFECDDLIPLTTDFMLMVYPVQKQYRKSIPAVTHIDGSGRIQTIRREQNKRYHDLIKEFGKSSGIPILINTSFNIRGEPIVCTPYDAYKCMMGTGIDCLVIGKYLIKRSENMRDAWDSDRQKN